MNEIAIKQNTGMGIFDPDVFDKSLKVAEQLAKSSIVPVAYVGNPSNCLVALEIANRTGVSALAVMQNLNVIQGKPGWSSQYIIGALNSTGKFSPLRFKIETELQKREIEYNEYVWNDAAKKKVPVAKKATILNRTCVAYATEKETGEVIEGPRVSLEMAYKEGWATKENSKWMTMEDLMLRYRAAAFFGRLYAPEILIGLSTAEELHDTAERDITPQSQIPSNPETSRVDSVKSALSAIVGEISPEPEPVLTIDGFMAELKTVSTIDELDTVAEKYRGKFETPADNKIAKSAYSARAKELNSEQ